MSAPAVEHSRSLLNTPEQQPYVEQPEIDVTLEALKAHFGLPVITYDARLRKDYEGDASSKVRCGGAMIISCTVLTPEGFTPKEVEANKDDFDAVVLAKLGAIANAKWADKTKKNWVRDYGRNR